MSRLRISVVCLLLIAACGNDDIALSSFPNDYRDSLCEYYVRCGLIKDQATCRILLQPSNGLAQVENFVNHGSVTYSGSQASACANQISGLSCNPGAEGNRTDESPCDHVFTGTVATGGACFDDVECVSGSCTQTDAACALACCPGTCDPAQPALATLGQSCASVNCVASAFCDDANMCVALKAQGAACDFNAQCAFGLTCLGEVGACLPAVSAGQACVGGECGTRGLVCDPVSVTCKHLLFDGATCDPSNSLCASYLRCDATSLTCVAGPALGAACTGVCAPGGFCKQAVGGGTGVCTAPQANGATCTSNSQCTTRFCSDADTCGDVPVCF